MPKWTSEQQKAIRETGNLLVSAAAGAGKTAVMTERVTKLISDGTDVNAMLIVTFTNAAAAEMKQRIAKRLAELAENEADFQKRLFLNAAVNDIPRADISTFHGFCGNLLKRCCHEVKLDPAFRIADAAEASLIKYESLDETLEEAYSEQEQTADPDFNALCSVIKNDDALSELILNVYDFLMARPEPFDWLKEAVSAYGENFDEFSENAGRQLLGTAKRNIRVFYEQADALYRNLEQLSPDDPMKYERTLFSDMEKLNAFLHLPNYEAWHNALNEFKLAALPRSKKGGTVPVELKNYRDALKKLFKKLSTVFSESIDAEREEAKAIFPVMNEILKLTERFYKKYSERKKEASLIDFSDMEQFALEALKNPEIASEYREKYKYIFIDEYQDTNSVQEKIISLIARENNLFMVGDVKQSIYRFRQAEPENFLDKYTRYARYDEKNEKNEKKEKIGKRIDLNANFRSYTSILSAVNLLFSKLMLGGIGEIDYSDNASLVPGAGAETKRGHVEIVILADEANAAVKTENQEQKEDGAAEAAEESKAVTAVTNITNVTNESIPDDAEIDSPDGECKTLALDTAQAEALYTAKQILYLMQNSLVFDKEKNIKRKPVFSDFAVLLRKTRNSAIQWVNLLTGLGIPCAADLGDGFFDAVEVQIFMNLLRVIDNKHQDIPLMSVLCSPIGNFTDSELLSVRCDYSGDDFYSKLLNASEGKAKSRDNKENDNNIKDNNIKDNNNNKDKDKDKDKIKAENKAESSSEAGYAPMGFPKARLFIEKLLLWQKECQFMKLDEFIGMLLDATGFYAHLGALNGGSLRQANLDMLENYAHTFEENGRSGLYGFISFMDGIKDRARVSAAAAPSLNAVHIMSIHKSKGLEFPVVFIAGLFNRFSEQSHRDYVLLDPLLGIGLKLRNKKLSKTLLHRAILARDDEKKYAEEMRILYVAMTRARERLYMIGCPASGSFDTEKYAAPLSDYQIMNAKNYMKWIMGAFFPAGIPESPEKTKISRPVGNDTLFLKIEPRPSPAVSERRMNKKRYSEWRASARLADSENILEKLSFDYPYKEDTLTPSKKSVTELMGADAEYEPAVPAFMENTHIPTAAERGSAVHTLLSLLPLKAINEAELAEYIKTFAGEKRLAFELITGGAFSSVALFLNSPLYKRMLSAEKVERELEFSLLLEAGDREKALKHKDKSVNTVDNSSFFKEISEGSLLQGIIDCCFLENGEWVIVDYKTNSLLNSTPYSVASRYETQLDIYALALEKLTGFPVKEKWIYLLNASTAVLL